MTDPELVEILKPKIKKFGLHISKVATTIGDDLLVEVSNCIAFCEELIHLCSDHLLLNDRFIEGDEEPDALIVDVLACVCSIKHYCERYETAINLQMSDDITVHVTAEDPAMLKKTFIRMNSFFFGKGTPSLPVQSQQSGG